MGLGDFFSGFGKAIKGAWNNVTSFVSSAAGKIVSGGKELLDTAKGAAITVYNDAKSLVKGIGGTVTYAIDKGTGVAQNAFNTLGSTISSVGSSLSTPLAIGALGLGAFFLLKKT